MLKRSYIKKPTYEEWLAKQKLKPRKTIIKKPKEKTDKEKLDTVFSLYMRIKGSNQRGMTMCVTCQDVRHYTDKMDWGHFIPRGNLATRYDETNGGIQCVSCNRFNGGEPELMGEYVAVKYGPEQLTILLQKSKEITKDFPYKEKIEYYKGKLKELKADIEIVI